MRTTHALCAMMTLSLGCAATSIPRTGLMSQVAGTSAANRSDQEPPSLEDPELAQYVERYREVSAAFKAAPNLEDIAGPSVCELPAEKAEKLAFHASIAEVEKGGEGYVQKVENFRWRVVEGECTDGLLQGEAVVRLQYTQIFRAGGAKTVTETEQRVEGEFLNGAQAGEYTSIYRMNMNVPRSRSDLEITMFAFGTKNGEEAGNTVTFQERENLPLATSVSVPLEPGLQEVRTYSGPQQVSVGYLQDGKRHGEFRTLPRDVNGYRIDGTMMCYNGGQMVNPDACDGREVDLALAKPVPVGKGIRTIPAAEATASTEKVTASTEPAPAAGETTASSASTAAAAPTATPMPGGAPSATPGKESPWPELSTFMAATGGGENDTAIIVGIEDYAFVSDVPGASTNAKDWYRYFTRVRKTPAGNVRLLLGNDATDVGIRAAFEQAAKLSNPEGTLWFVFIGHGAPAEDGKDGLIVGVDAQQSAQGLYGRSVPQKELVGLAAKGSQQTTVFVVDACFSGRASDGAALASGLQPLLPVKQKPVDKRTLIFTAGRADQFAGPLPKLDRPAFSYLFLGGMLGWGDANSDGWVSSDEVMAFSSDTLRAVLNGRNQTPEMFPARKQKLGASAGAEAPDVTAIVLGD